MIRHDKCAPFEAEIERLKRENDRLKDAMLTMRARLSGKSVSFRSFKIIDECLVKAGVMKEEESIQWKLYGKRILKEE